MPIRDFSWKRVSGKHYLFLLSAKKWDEEIAILGYHDNVTQNKRALVVQHPLALRLFLE